MRSPWFFLGGQQQWVESPEEKLHVAVIWQTSFALGRP
jgi:hypothetical protein